MTEDNFAEGLFVLSVAGRDKNRIHLIAFCDDEYVYVVDGDTRKVEKPKKKKKKHVFLLDMPKYDGVMSNKAIKRKICEITTMQKKTGGIFLSKEDVVEFEGQVIEALPNATFKVKLPNGHIINARISGKLRMNYIWILPGDKVTVEVSVYDLTKGRITWRAK